MKRKTAGEILAESFRELTEKKNVEKITVLDITENCGYSTTTFYRHFRDKYDLMSWEYAERINAIIKDAGKDIDSWREIWLKAAQMFSDQRSYLKKLLLHTGGMDSFVQYMKKIHYEGLSAWIMSASGIDRLDVKTEMYVMAYCQGSVDISCEWILGRYDVTPGDLAEIFEGCLPQPLRSFLIG